MQSATLSADVDPLEALCHYLHVQKIRLPVGEPLPATLTIPIIQEDARKPTHLFAIFDTPPAGAPLQYVVVPAPADLFIEKFRCDAIPSTRPDSPSPAPPSEEWSPSQPVITLPVIPLSVPHAPSVPLLLLYALGLQPHPTAMATHLLPYEAIEEFPSAAAMSQAMARACSDAQLRQYVVFNQGLWKNILALGPRDTQVIELVQTVWNVTAEARRIRQRGGMY